MSRTQDSMPLDPDDSNVPSPGAPSVTILQDLHARKGGDQPNLLNPGVIENAALEASRQAAPPARARAGQQAPDLGQRVAGLENFCYHQLRGHRGITVQGPNIILDSNAMGGDPANTVRLVVTVDSQGRFANIQGQLGGPVGG